MRVAILCLVLAVTCLAGCGDDGGPRLDEEDGACLARELSQDPPDEGDRQLEQDDVEAECPDR
jgi:hypothetical protein